MNLSKLGNEQTARVAALRLPLAQKQRLACLGILPGCAMRMIRNTGRGSIVVEYRGTFLAMARSIADRISLASN